MKPRDPEIFCPECKYKPVPLDRWDCVPSCGTRWHTFWTGGVCPGCGWHWEKTQCPKCGELSPHKAWYHYPEGGEPANDEKVDQPETAPAH